MEGASHALAPWSQFARIGTIEHKQLLNVGGPFAQPQACHLPISFFEIVDC